MTLKIGAIPDHKPCKISLLVPPELKQALQDYAVIHAKQYGQKVEIGILAVLMLEHFLSSDTAFKRERKALQRTVQE